MNKAEKTALLDILSGLAEYFNYELTKYIITAYLEDLNEYSILQIKKAASVIRKNSKYFPKIAEIIETINIIDGNINLSLDDRAEIAWSLVLKAIRDYSYDKSFTFRDKAIRKALETVGYDNIRECSESEINWKKADFIKVYKVYAKLNPNSYPAPDYIAGFIELTNPPTDIKEKPGLYLGQSVYIAEDDVRVKHKALTEYLKLTGGKNVEYAKIA
ncbi:MAG: hypothetical protein ACYCS0_01380 [bacterium]